MSLLSDEMYVDVISNASMEIYEENTLSKFTNKLRVPLIFDDEWEVGIKEIFYPLSSKPIRRKVQIVISPDPGEEYTTDFYYNDSDETAILLKDLNGVMTSICPEHWTAPLFELY